MMPDYQDPQAVDYPAERYVMTPMAIFGMPGFRKIRKATIHAKEFWDFVVILAKEANQAGRILAGRERLGAEELADLWHFGEDEKEWQKFLDAAVKAGWLDLVDDVYRLANPMQWYRPPSRSPEAERERKRREREAKKADCPQASAEVRNGPHEPNRTKLNQTELNPTEPSRVPAREGGDSEKVSRTEGNAADLVLSVAEHFWAIEDSRCIASPVERGAQDTSPNVARSAARETIRELLWECHNGGEGKPREPARLFARRFKQHLAAAAAHANSNLKKADRRIAAVQLYPYRWQHPDEWSCPPQLVNDFYLTKTVLGAEPFIVPAPSPEESAAKPSSPAQVPDNPLSLASLSKLAKSIE